MRVNNVNQLIERFTLRNREIYIWGEIDDGYTSYIVSRINFLVSKSKEPIYIYIHSRGGDVDGECAIIDEMIAAQNSGVVINTIVLGMAYSAASSILALGTKGFRFARPSSSIMLHPCSYSLGEDYAGNQKELTKYLERKIQYTNKLIAKACGVEDPNGYKAFLRKIDKGLWLTSEEATKFGIVDKVVTEYVGINNAKTNNE
jgi:ATP-dependent Clp protease, protease subunit